jgi:hypothetical protein
MDSCTDKYTFFGQGFGTFGVFVFAGDSEEIALVSSERSGKEAFVKKVLSFGVFFYSI